MPEALSDEKHWRVNTNMTPNMNLSDRNVRFLNVLLLSIMPEAISDEQKFGDITIYTVYEPKQQKKNRTRHTLTEVRQG